MQIIFLETPQPQKPLTSTQMWEITPKDCANEIMAQELLLNKPWGVDFLCIMLLTHTEHGFIIMPRGIQNSPIDLVMRSCTIAHIKPLWLLADKLAPHFNDTPELSKRKEELIADLDIKIAALQQAQNLRPSAAHNQKTTCCSVQ